MCVTNEGKNNENSFLKINSGQVIPLQDVKDFPPLFHITTASGILSNSGNNT